nr:tryptophan 2,3-dioxygenase family protein [Calditrichia bacterium]
MSSHSDREISYGSYLQLNSILNSQSPVSSDTPSPAHDEMLFIIIHQVYELWFKQILHELDSVMSMFREDYVDEKNIGVAVSRLERVVEIEKVIIDQIRILETMTPLDFLEFRNLLTPASGFQSLQFRILEIKLGLRTAERIRYSQTAYQHHYPEGEQTLLAGLEQQASLFELLENWLERTPFLEYTGFNFTRTFREAVEQMLAAEWEMVENSAMSVGEKEQRRQMMETNRRHFESLL